MTTPSPSSAITVTTERVENEQLIEARYQHILLVYQHITEHVPNQVSKLNEIIESNLELMSESKYQRTSKDLANTVARLCEVRDSITEQAAIILSLVESNIRYRNRLEIQLEAEKKKIETEENDNSESGNSFDPSKLDDIDNMLSKLQTLMPSMPPLPPSSGGLVE